MRRWRISSRGREQYALACAPRIDKIVMRGGCAVTATVLCMRSPATGVRLGLCGFTIAPNSDFYGGWITADLVGPFRGSPGTLGW